jgi:hypothetical protein
MCILIKFRVSKFDTIRGTPRGLCEALAELATNNFSFEVRSMEFILILNVSEKRHNFNNRFKVEGTILYIIVAFILNYRVAKNYKLKNENCHSKRIYSAKFIFSNNPFSISITVVKK